MLNRNCKCLRCGHTWRAKGKGEPICCPKCKSYFWNKKPSGKTSEKVGELIESVCTKCKKNIPDGENAYHLQEGVVDNGLYKVLPDDNRALYCEDCAPPEDQFPFKQ